MVASAFVMPRLGGLTLAVQPRRLTVPSAADGCNRLLGGRVDAIGSHDHASVHEHRPALFGDRAEEGLPLKQMILV